MIITIIVSRHYADNDGDDDDNGDDDDKDDGCHVHHILGRKAHRHPTHVQLMAQKADNGFAPRSNVQCSYEQCTCVLCTCTQRLYMRVLYL